MNQSERQDFLLRALLAEEPQYQSIVLPSEDIQKQKLLRALMNLRPPRPVDQTFLELQDAYLSALIAQKGITDADRLPAIPGETRLALWRGDITTLRADGIVNAANSALLGCFSPLHHCIDNAIHSAAGVQLRLVCHTLMKQQGHPEPTGQAKMTPGFNLPARFVLHTVGPIVQQLSAEDCALLASCYRSCLTLAAENGLRSVAFCCISTGEFHFPNELAAEIAVKTTKDFLKKDRTIKKVIFNVFKERDEAIYRKLLGTAEADTSLVP